MMPAAFDIVGFSREEESARYEWLIVQGFQSDDSALQSSHYCSEVDSLEWVEGGRLSALSGGIDAADIRKRF